MIKDIINQQCEQCEQCENYDNNNSSSSDSDYESDDSTLRGCFSESTLWASTKHHTDLYESIIGISGQDHLRTPSLGSSDEEEEEKEEEIFYKKTNSKKNEFAQDNSYETHGFNHQKSRRKDLERNTPSPQEQYHDKIPTISKTDDIFSLIQKRLSNTIETLRKLNQEETLESIFLLLQPEAKKLLITINNFSKSDGNDEPRIRQQLNRYTFHEIPPSLAFGFAQKINEIMVTRSKRPLDSACHKKDGSPEKKQNITPSKYLAGKLEELETTARTKTLARKKTLFTDSNSQTESNKTQHTTPPKLT